MATVDAGGEEFTVYADVDAADIYLAGSIHATNWAAATEDTKAKALVTATRVLDRQRWRTGYTTQAARLVVQSIIDASIEMALALIDGSDLQSEAVTGQKLQSIRAGSVALTYFRGADGSPHRFPTIVHELLRDYLAGGDVASLIGKSSGTGGISSTAEDFGHTEGL